MVYVLSETGQPLMPTENHSKVRILLKAKKAIVIEDFAENPGRFAKTPGDECGNLKTT